MRIDYLVVIVNVLRGFSLNVNSRVSLVFLRTVGDEMSEEVARMSLEGDKI